jgi:hypothetical protein
MAQTAAFRDDAVHLFPYGPIALCGATEGHEDRCSDVGVVVDDEQERYALKNGLEYIDFRGTHCPRCGAPICAVCRLRGLLMGIR